MLEIQKISFAYETKNVIDNISFNIQKGQNLAIIGESGSGKSTLLQLIYGLHDLHDGQIFWNNEAVLGPKFNLVPGATNMKYLTQDFDLMPYISVEENVGRYLSNMFPQEKKTRIKALLAMVEMTDFRHAKAKYLSGGQQQRVALAQVLALEPDVLLLDEPFRNIDGFRKGALRRNLFAYLKNKNITCVFATHDSIDALSFSDETIVMKNGQLVCHDDSKILYLKPKNKYVASLYGEVNEIPLPYLIPSEDFEKTILLYASDLFVTDVSDLQVTVIQCYFKGANYLIKAVFEGKALFFENPFPIDEDETICLTAFDDIIAMRL